MTPKSGRAWAGLAALTALLVAGNLAFLQADRRPPTYDDAWFLENSLVFHHHLTEGGLRSFVAAYIGSFGTKAPLLSVLPLPLYVLLGTGFKVALLVNVVFLVVSNLFLFLLVRRLYSPGAALAAVLFFQTMPLSYGLSRAFLADYGLTALVIVWLYFLDVSDHLRSGPINLLLGVLCGLGLLMKISFPAFVAGPLLLVLYQRWREEGSGRALLPALFSLALPAALLAATWYAFNLRPIVQYAWAGAYGDIGRQYGFGGFRYWLEMLVNRGTSVYYAGGLLVLGPAALLAGRHPPTEARRRGWFCAAWLVPPLLAAALASNREIRLVIPLLPPLAVLLAAAIERLGRRPWVPVVLVLLVAAGPLRLYGHFSFQREGGHVHELHPVHWGPLLFLSSDLGWARLPDTRGDWDQQRLLEALHRLAPGLRTPRYVVVGVEHPFLNANLLSYLNQYRRYPLLFTSLGYAESSVGKALERVQTLNARFLVMAEGFHSHDLPDFLNQMNTEVQARLDGRGLPYRLRAKVSLTHEIKAAIYEKEMPWMRFAPEAPAPQPTYARPVDFAGGVRFLGYDWERREGNEARLSTYWTVPHEIYEDFRVQLVFRSGGHVLLVEDHEVGNGRHPFFEWAAGEVVKQTVTVYLPRHGPLEAHLWLEGWGLGQPQQITMPRELIHESIVPLRLEE